MHRILIGFAALLVTLSTATAALAAPLVVVGSKRFTESYILGEIVRQTLQAQGIPAELRQGLGNTGILEQALESGAIDVYPEYTGTIAREILKSDAHLDLAALNARLAPLGLQAGDALGFDDSYALGMRASEADRLGVRDISDLARYPKLRLGFSHEFLGRADGWPGLKRAYGLPLATPLGIDHGLAYEALRKGEVDVIDLYSTDAKIERYHIAVLADDRHFFPSSQAGLLSRVDAVRRFPAAFAAFARLAGTIDAQRMVQLNARAELDHVPFATVAAEFLGHRAAPHPRGLWAALFAPDFGRLLVRHLELVFYSLAA
ncbi:MAG: ABC transporter permease, partial [Burkholderiales bacterium]|nr:ABC transporter permease [Burkholderiales bacterium]